MAPSKYHSIHQNPQGPGDVRPTALDIIADENLTSKLSSKTMLITGCSSGIGIETARALSTTDCKLFLTARNIPKARSALQAILKPGRVELLEMDLMSLASVRKAAEEFKRRSAKLDVLICNAGIMCPPMLERTEDGFESQFGVNHLAHFLLFNLLKETMLKSATKQKSARVVMVSSSGHRNSGVLVGDYNFDKGKYVAGKAYGQSKTANVYMANEIERRYGERGLHANSLMPGGIMTGLQVHFDEETTKQMGSNLMCKSPEQGAATSVLAAVGEEWEGVGGKYLEDCEEAPLLGGEWSWTEPGYVKHAFDAELEKKLWVDSLDMLGLKDED